MNPRFISFHYTLKDKAGKVLDSSHDTDPMTYIEGAQQIIPGLEKGITGLNAGDKKHVVVEAEEAYGVRDERLLMEVPLAELPNADKVEEGAEYNVQLEDQSSQVFRVIAVSKTHATLDGNHPLASEDLFFDIEVKEAREATKEEMETADEEEACCDHDHDHEGHQH